MSTDRPPPRSPEHENGGAAPCSEELQTLCHQAETGGVDAVRGLIQWAMREDTENQGLRRRLRKQAHDFSTLFEIVSQTSARSLDLGRNR